MYLLTAFGFGKVIGIYGVILAYAIQLVLNKGFKLFYLICRYRPIVIGRPRPFVALLSVESAV